MNQRPNTATKLFGHTFYKNPPPCQPGWYCAACGYFTPKMTDKEKALVCGRVTYPVEHPCA